MAPPPEDVYCTLLLNDAYLPGAQVLAHSLRDGGTKYRLAIMVTLGGVSQASVTELKKLYDYVIPVDPIYSSTSANLHLMRRLDLHAALTKINLWKLTQFRKVVYVDADMVALRVPDELFDVDADFAAAPDAGWPDCFNSGLMVLKPDTNTFDQLTKLASQGETFDGADQGLLNQHFPNWHRLSFAYNCTIGGNVGYQYAPAFKHYGSNVSMAHFIGATKPWDRGNVPGLSSSNEPYEKLSGYWWEVYNKHQSASQQSSNESWASKGVSPDYQTKTADSSVGGKAAGAPTEATGSGLTESDAVVEKEAPSGSVQQAQAPVAEAPVDSPSVVETPAPVAAMEAEPVVAAKTEVVAREPQFVPIRSVDQPSRSEENFTHSHYEKFKADGKLGEFVMTKEGPVAQAKYFQTSTETYHIQEYYPDGKPVTEDVVLEAPKEKVPELFIASVQHWDPSRFAPPQHGAPEADKLRIMPYENEWDKPRSSTYVAPAFAPPPKQHLWYDMPGASAQVSAPPAKTIFPWEAKPRQVTRVFNDVIPAAPETQAEEPEVEEEEVYYDSEEGESAADPTEIIPAPVEPPLRTIFPWEQKPRTVTRVFAQDVSPQVRRTQVAAAAPKYDVADEPDETLVGTEDWKNFVSRENKWDTDPAIKDYVLGLRKRRSQASEPPVSSAVLAEVPPITPNPLRQVAPAAAETGAEKEPEWDPEAKLEELRRLPPSILSKLIAKMQDPNVLPEDDEDRGRGRKSVTPKASMRFPHSYEDADVNLKEIAGMPVDATRARSIDSALGSAIDD